MTDNKLLSLIQLLDDPDDKIFSQIDSLILKYGELALPILDQEWRKSIDNNCLRDRLESLIYRISQKELFYKITKWINSDSKDLLEAILILCKYHYIELDEQEINNTLDEITREAWIVIDDNLTNTEKINQLNYIFYNKYNFSSSSEKIKSLDNLLINNVIKTKKGNSMALGIIYCLVAQRLKLPIYGVNLPLIFILCYLDENNKVDFYINPTNNGNIFAKEEILVFLQQFKIEPLKPYFEPCSSTEIIKRLIRYIIFVYENEYQEEKIDDLKKVINLLQNKNGIT